MPYRLLCSIGKKASSVSREYSLKTDEENKKLKEMIREDVLAFSKSFSPKMTFVCGHTHISDHWHQKRPAFSYLNGGSAEKSPFFLYLSSREIQRENSFEFTHLKKAFSLVFENKIGFYWPPRDKLPLFFANFDGVFWA